MNISDVQHLRGPILRSVSRSFYLSLRVLPEKLRDPLSLAYLLARTTDTVADTAEAPMALRIQALRTLADVIQGTVPAETIADVQRSFVSWQTNDAERALIDALPAVLGWLEILGERDRSEVREVLNKINEGQTLDLERFGTGPGIRALPSGSDLDDYTYLVAGCVGEFWTRICFAHLGNFSDRPESEMLVLGKQYGKALQLINILRDAWPDLKSGRCYLPKDELQSLGMTPDDILTNPGRVKPILQSWQEKAERGLEAGLEYACAINACRVRFATALPALIGGRTLALLRNAGADLFTGRVKVARSEVRSIMASVALNRASASSLRRTFRRASGSNSAVSP